MSNESSAAEQWRIERAKRQASSAVSNESSERICPTCGHSEGVNESGVCKAWCGVWPCLHRCPTTAEAEAQSVVEPELSNAEIARELSRKHIGALNEMSDAIQAVLDAKDARSRPTVAESCVGCDPGDPDGACELCSLTWRVADLERTAKTAGDARALLAGVLSIPATWEYIMAEVKRISSPTVEAAEIREECAKIAESRGANGVAGDIRFVATEICAEMAKVASEKANGFAKDEPKRNPRELQLYVRYKGMADALREAEKRIRAAAPAPSATEILARRAYPDLKRSGLCSAHRENGHFECPTCYIDPNALLSDHMKVQNALYDQLLEISGLSDPPNGRVGTNAIVAEIRRQLAEIRRQAFDEAAQVADKEAWDSYNDAKAPDAVKIATDIRALAARDAAPAPSTQNSGDEATGDERDS